MKPTKLKRNDTVKITLTNTPDRKISAIFIKRIPRQQGRSAQNLFEVAEYIDMNGQGDDGLIFLNDYEVMRYCSLMTRK